MNYMNVDELNRHAELQLKVDAWRKDIVPSAEAVEGLLHELRVKEIELEMQREELRQSRAEIEAGLDRFTNYFDFAPTSYITLQRDGSIQEINLAGANLIGLERERLIGKRLGFFVATESVHTYSAFLNDVFSSHTKLVCEVKLITADKKPPFVHIEAIADPSGMTCRASLLDITQRKEIENKLYESEAFFRTITENASDLIALLDTDGRRIYNSPSYRQTMQAFGKNWPEPGSDSFREIHPEDRDRIRAIFRKTVETGVGERAEFRFLLSDGSVRYIESEGNAVHDASGKVSKVIVISRDVTERKQAEAQLQHFAHYDILTDLPNRRLFSDRLQQALVTAKREKTRLAVMLLDLDMFKPINDSLGHDVGDLMLKEIARRIQDCMRGSDSAARMGGDEFIVLLPSIEAEKDAMTVAEKIRSALNQPFELAGHNLHISASIGIAIYPEHGNDEFLLCKNADIAMYHAKKKGHNNVQYFKPDMQ